MRAKSNSCQTCLHASAQAMLHEHAHEEGGLGFTNKELLASQRGWGLHHSYGFALWCHTHIPTVFVIFGNASPRGNQRDTPASSQNHPLIRACDLRRRAIVDIAKDLGRKLLTGSLNLINLSMPVRMFEERSYLQKLADVWVYPRCAVSRFFLWSLERTSDDPLHCKWIQC